MSHRDIPTIPENLEQQKQRLEALWDYYKATVEKDPELMSLFGRRTELASTRSPSEILRAHGYPPRSKIADLQFENWQVHLNPKFIKDGFIYLLRGDHPNQQKKGFYSRPYGYAQLTTAELATRLKESKEAGYFLYQNEKCLTVLLNR